MSDQAASVDRVLDLAEAVCSKQASENDLAELDSLLHADQESRSRYLSYCWMHVSLRLQLRAHRGVQEAQQQINIDSTTVVSDGFHVAAAEAPSIPPVGFLPTTLHGAIGCFSSGWPVAYLIATVVFGIGLVIGAFTQVSQPEHFTNTASPTAEQEFEPASTMQFVGRITGMVDCQWSDDSTAAINGQHVSLGRKYALSSGLMEITYDTRAKVILQGPITYEVDGHNGGFLSIGKLTGRVEVEAAKGFSIRTPTATVTDLGTEFGVEVRDSGMTTAHVFRGAVEVQSAEYDGRQSRAVRLVENESAQVERLAGGDGFTVSRSIGSPVTFVRIEQLPKLAEELRLKPFRRWQAYSQQLRRDPSLLAYYDFQQKKGEPGVLPNVAGNGDKSFDGVVTNATWTAGPMAGKDALQFQSPDSYVRINLPREVDDLTLAAWLRPLSYHNAFSCLLMSDGWKRPGEVHWEMDCRDGTIPLCVLGWPTPYPSFQGVLGTCYRRWMHCAAVYDHATTSVAFYLNGELRSETTVSGHTTICIGSAQIGQWEPEDWEEAKHMRGFHGQIDEMAIFRRPLKAEEIQGMYQAGKPPDSRDEQTIVPTGGR